MKYSIYDVAEACHTANKIYCESIGDNSQSNWEDAPEWQKESAVKGVQHLIENPDAKPSDSHDSWLKEKREQGWVYGEVKDPIKKIHPCFVAYEELPQEQKNKDYIFIAVARSLLRYINS